MDTDPIDADGYAIRRARPEELGALPAIERAAAVLFRATTFPQLAEAALASERIDCADAVWVARSSSGEPVAFAITHALAASVHLHEIDVHPAHARRGLGRRLIAAVAARARRTGLPAVTLTTFRDVPWNAPYYARLGFRSLITAELTDELRAIVQAEAAAGLPVEERVCMRLDLASTLPAVPRR